MPTKAYGAYASDRKLEAIDIERRKPGAKDVQIEIAYCGVCHSDLHTVRSEWAGTLFPCVPGHEIVGRVSSVGSEVTKFKVGDTVGVGCMVNSCQHCESCADGLEQYCENGLTFTYNSPIADPPGHTLGGYSQRIVVDENFVLRIRHSESQLAAAAPLLCAGITTYSPLRHWNAGPGKKVGIVGIGGLGHLGIKLAHAMGAAHGRVHDIGEQTQGCDRARRRRGRHFEERGRDEAAREQLRLHPRHGRRESQPRCVHDAAETRRHALPRRHPRISASEP